ncbi:hypothetical protein [Algibacter sp.]|uniref:hypothetical protein n=1 Tax=Algibacter sp. TaxID=1872428 RepID=UPI003C7097FA
MLGILLIYFIGKRFYDLSEEYNQNKWLYAILSVVIYYVAGFVVGIIIALLDLYIFNWGIDWDNNFGINLLGLPAGLLILWGFYIFLENKWKKSVLVIKDEINDIGKNTDEF